MYRQYSMFESDKTRGGNRQTENKEQRIRNAE